MVLGCLAPTKTTVMAWALDVEVESHVCNGKVLGVTWWLCGCLAPTKYNKHDEGMDFRLHWGVTVSGLILAEFCFFWG